MEAIILAGGLGTRLRPYTDVIPKPLLPLGGTPILEIILRQLAAAGVDRVTLALHYRAEVIQAHVGDGSRFGLQVEHSVADRLLGTAGPLGLIERPRDACLVLNADLLTNLDYRDLMARHRSRGAPATVVLFPYRTEVPFGVIDVDGQGDVAAFREKPSVEASINAGIYVLEPLVWDKVPPGEYLEMSELIVRALAKGRTVATYRHAGDWLDVGTVESFRRGDEVFRPARPLPAPRRLDPARRGGPGRRRPRHGGGLMPEVALADPGLGEPERAAVDRVMRSGWISMGPEVAAFEEEFAAALGTGGAVHVSSGTAALHLAALALGWGPGDEVVVPSLTFVATAATVAAVGATPVFADVRGDDDLTLDPADVLAALTPRTRGIVAVHYGGWPAHLDVLRAVAEGAGLALVEDAAHTPPEPRGGGALGTVGDVGCFSLHATKNLTAGEGGVVVARDPATLARVRALRSHAMSAPSWDRQRGRASAYDVAEVGFNYRPTDLTAAIARVQLGKLPAEQAARRARAAEYRRLLAALPVAVPFTGRPAAPPPAAGAGPTTCRRCCCRPAPTAPRCRRRCGPPGCRPASTTRRPTASPPTAAARPGRPAWPAPRRSPPGCCRCRCTAGSPPGMSPGWSTPSPTPSPSPGGMAKRPAGGTGRSWPMAVAVRDGRLARGGEPWFPVGANYHPGSVGVAWLRSWRPAEVAADLAAMAGAGLDCVRAFAYWADIEPSEGRHDPVVVDRLRTFGALAAAEGLGVVLSVPTVWMNGHRFLPPWFGDRDPWRDPVALARAEAAVGAVAGALAGSGADVLYDLGDEVMHVDPRSRDLGPRRGRRLAEPAGGRGPGRAPRRGGPAGQRGLRRVRPPRLRARQRRRPRPVRAPRLPPVGPAAIAGHASPLASRLVPFLVRYGRAHAPVLVDEVGAYAAGPEVVAAHLRATLPAAAAAGAAGAIAWSWTDVAAAGIPFDERPSERTTGMVDGAGRPRPGLAALAEAAADARCTWAQARWAPAPVALFLPERARTPERTYLQAPSPDGLALFHADVLCARAQLPCEVTRRPAPRHRLVVCPAAGRLTERDIAALEAAVDGGATLLVTLGDPLHGDPGTRLAGAAVADFVPGLAPRLLHPGRHHVPAAVGGGRPGRGAGAGRGDRRRRVRRRHAGPDPPPGGRGRRRGVAAGRPVRGAARRPRPRRRRALAPPVPARGRGRGRDRRPANLPRARRRPAPGHRRRPARARGRQPHRSPGDHHRAGSPPAPGPTAWRCAWAPSRRPPCAAPPRSPSRRPSWRRLSGRSERPWHRRSGRSHPSTSPASTGRRARAPSGR